MGICMFERFLLVLWEFVYFSLAIYGFLSIKGKQASPVGVVAGACIGLLY